MNILSVFITLINASLLAGTLSGLFFDLPVRGTQNNKERVQTTLLQTVSEQDTEISNMKSKIEQLKKDIPEYPAKIETIKSTIEMRKADLSMKKRQFDLSSSTLMTLRKQNAEKEKQLKELKGLKVKKATSTPLVLESVPIGTTTEKVL